MNFHPDDFLSLIEEVEAQGGAHISSETCKPTKFRSNQPIDPDVPRGPKRSQILETAGCHRRAKFMVPVLPEAYFDGRELADLSESTAESVEFDFDDESNPSMTMADGSPAMTKACAVDDAMGLWPRFRQSMHTGHSFQE